MNASVNLTSRAQNHIDAIDSEIETRSPRRADEFLNVVNTKIEQLAQFPKSGAVHRGNIRRLLLLRFPYSLFYTFDATQNAVTIIACFHDRSDPRTWR